MAKGGGRVPRDGALTAPARGKPLLSILPNTAGRKRHPRGTDKEHGHKAAIKAVVHTYIHTYIHTYRPHLNPESALDIPQDQKRGQEFTGMSLVIDKRLLHAG